MVLIGIDPLPYCFGMFWVSCELATRHSKDHPKISDKKKSWGIQWFPKSSFFQWPFQDPKMEVPTIYKAYCLGLCKGISPENMARNMVQYLQFRFLKWPLTFCAVRNIVLNKPVSTSISKYKPLFKPINKGMLDMLWPHLFNHQPSPAPVPVPLTSPQSRHKVGSAFPDTKDRTGVVHDPFSNKQRTK